MKINIYQIYQIEKKRVSLGKFHFSELRNLLEDEEFLTKDELLWISKQETSDYFFLYFGKTQLQFRDENLLKFIEFAQNGNYGIIYSDFYLTEKNQKSEFRTIDYQFGSIRDDFEFGNLLMVKKEFLVEYLKEAFHWKYSTFYDYRLFVSQISEIGRIPEFLYSVEKEDSRKSGEKMFDYVKSINKVIQKEREEVATLFLERINATIQPKFEEIEYPNADFQFTASVIIPVKNREITIEQAIKSALSQKTNFRFNVIVVDNHSTDNTTEILKNLAKIEEKLIHIIPKQTDLGIGGCWNLAIDNENCGMFSVQLDSDDIYLDEETLQKIVDKFTSEKSAVVVGSYKITDFQLKEIPPRIVNHEEWTENNGMNNALRINGFGAPRAFFTPILRQIRFPNVSYGEDYSVMIRITRNYKLSRIFEPIYIVRRWEGNSDSDLSNEKMNKFNFYKDLLRSDEILARQEQNAGK